VDLGCGAVQVDPRTVADPDRGRAPGGCALPDDDPRTDRHDDPRTDRHRDAGAQPFTDRDPRRGGRSHAGILVGDFSSVEAADSAVATIQQAFGGAATLEIVDSLTAPNIVRPGVWAVVMLLPATPMRWTRWGTSARVCLSIKIGAGSSPHERDPSENRRSAGEPGARFGRCSRGRRPRSLDFGAASGRVAP
jgi:hypothetical protein